MIVLRQKLSRGQVVVRLANMQPCQVGMEACVGAHHLSRQLLALGHDVKAGARGRCRYLGGRPVSISPRPPNPASSGWRPHPQGRAEGLAWVSVLLQGELRGV